MVVVVVVAKTALTPQLARAGASTGKEKNPGIYRVEELGTRTGPAEALRCGHDGHARAMDKRERASERQRESKGEWVGR